MRVALGQIRTLDQETAEFALQLGITSVQFNTPAIDGEAGYWSYEALAKLKTECNGYGLVLEALENVPRDFMTNIFVDGPERERQLGNYCTTIENMGRAGIPLLGHNFMPTGVWRTAMDAPSRGGATASAFDVAKAASGNVVADNDVVVITEAELWASYELFLERTLPVAESAGVRLALHPDDPPVPAIGRTARLFYSVDNLARGYDLAKGSPAWGLDLCLGTVSEMLGGGDAVRDAVRRFAPIGAICYVHFRQVKGTVPSFTECFLGEGNYSPREIITLLARNGFDGFLLDDHVPRLSFDSPWGHRSHAYAIGYLQGLMNDLPSAL